MSEVKWIKLSTQMFEDEKIRLIESMPESDAILIIWVRLLSQAGKTNSNGYIYLNENIPYTDEMLATIFNRPLGTVRMALQVFSNFGMIDIDENQFISISNWEKHQNIDGLDKLREQNRKRVEKHRKIKQKTLKPPTPPTTQKKTSVTPCNVTVNGEVMESNAIELDLELDLELDKDLDINQQQTRPEIPEEKVQEKKDAADVDSPGMVFRFYENNIGPLVPHIADRLSVMIDESSESLVQESLKRAVDINATNKMKYADAVLRGWQDKRFKNLSAVFAADKEHERRKQQYTGYGSKAVREELLPEWFNKPEEEHVPETVPPANTDWEAEKQKLLAQQAAKKAALKGEKS